MADITSLNEKVSDLVGSSKYKVNKNDIKSTTFLAGLLIDLHGNSNRLQAEFEQRIADDLKLFVDFSLNGTVFPILISSFLILFLQSLHFVDPRLQ